MDTNLDVETHTKHLSTKYYALITSAYVLAVLFAISKYTNLTDIEIFSLNIFERGFLITLVVLSVPLMIWTIGLAVESVIKDWERQLIYVAVMGIQLFTILNLGFVLQLI